MKRPSYYVIHVATSIASEIIILEGLKILAKGCGVCGNVPREFILFGGVMTGIADTTLRIYKDYTNDKKKKEGQNESRKEQEV